MSPRPVSRARARIDGTLAHRMTRGQATGRAFLKTGTLLDTRALAGDDAFHLRITGIGGTGVTCPVGMGVAA